MLHQCHFSRNKRSEKFLQKGISVVQTKHSGTQCNIKKEHKCTSKCTNAPFNSTNQFKPWRYSLAFGITAFFSPQPHVAASFHPSAFALTWPFVALEQLAACGRCQKQPAHACTSFCTEHVHLCMVVDAVTLRVWHFPAIA